MAVGDIGKSQICDSNPSVTFGDSSLNTREPPVYVRLVRSGHASRDDGHLVDLVGVAAAGEVVDGRVQTLQDGAVGLKTAEPLGDLVADVAGFNAREDEGVGVARDLAARELQLTDDRGDRRVKLHFAVWVTVWVRQIRYPKIRTNKRENRRKSYDFHRFLELVAGLEPATC